MSLLEPLYKPVNAQMCEQVHKQAYMLGQDPPLFSPPHFSEDPSIQAPNSATSTAHPGLERTQAVGPWPERQHQEGRSRAGQGG